MNMVLIAASADVLGSMTALLEARGHNVIRFDNPTGALNYLKGDGGTQALVVFDQFKSMPGAEVCREARSLATFERRLYICLITRPLNQKQFCEALDCGADDLLQMPVSRDELYSRLRQAERFDELHTRLISMATCDSLTGLLNRGAFWQRGEDLVNSESITACIWVDIDHFKRINDTYGHAAGDEVIRFVAMQLRDDQTIVGRIGGEEFAILISDRDGQAAAVHAEALREKIVGQRIDVDGAGINVSCSFGVSMWQDGDNIDSLLRRADDALYLAKATGRNRVVIGNPSLIVGLDNPRNAVRSMSRDDAIPNQMHVQDFHAKS